ncbi:MAG: hypothetical protein UHT63_00835, partial [Acutalibacteraceae bacterium]|nr:hypothetical protein [Acutalibacteraceae bacterium]
TWEVPSAIQKASTAQDPLKFVGFKGITLATSQHYCLFKNNINNAQTKRFINIKSKDLTKICTSQKVQ